MIETLFSAPHNASLDEAKKIRSRYMGMDLDAMRGDQEQFTDDQRLTTIYELYALRGDQGQMDATLKRIADQDWAAELGYRDVYSKTHFVGAEA